MRSRWPLSTRLARTVVAAAFVALVAGCGGTRDTEAGGEGAPVAQQAPAGTITLASADWSSARASANVVKAVLEKRLGYRVRVDVLSAEEMWRAVAAGDADASVSAWLPQTHAGYRERYGDSIVDYGPNLENVRTGLVVPDVSVGRQTDDTGERTQPYIPVDSIPDLADYASRFDGRIIGIEPDAGVMRRTRDALVEYGLQDSLRLVAGSEEEMVAALERAIQTQSWVVVTGWTPHWAFGQWDLRFLDDPENVYGSSEAVHTIATTDLRERHPDAAAFLDAFNWTMEDIGRVALWIHRDNGTDPYGKALRWIDTHPDQVDTWLNSHTQ